MKKILSQARITEVGDIAKRLVSLYQATSTLGSDAFLSKTFAELAKLEEALTEAVKRDAVVSKLEDADAKRDEAIRVLGKLLKGYNIIPVESLKAHGKKLYEVFQKYGVKIVSENYSSQSNLINSLLQDLSAADLSASITALSGVSEAIGNLLSAQENFAQIRAEYDKALSQKINTESASSLRKPVLELINKKLIPYLVAMKIAQAEQYKTFADEVSQIIESINEAVKTRGKK
ncbi:MAG: DUF6261 family protein [Bergeyella zoohelcum]|nr:DUF6261 family protein [Bergeyella zoohelcum]